MKKSVRIKMDNDHPFGTRFFDAETGVEIKEVISFEILGSVDDLTIAKITVASPKVEISETLEFPAEVKSACPCCGREANGEEEAE